MTDSRWKQRLVHYLKVLKSFRAGLELAQQRELSDLENMGLIQYFKICHELAWNTLKELLEYQGISGMLGSRDTVREAFSRGLITHGNDCTACGD